MNFITSRKEALDVLENYIEKDILSYAAQRNFDFGPQNRKNISCLSPYITHRLISEYEVTKKVLSKLPYLKVEKFVQEIFWRVYWKGWLELRPNVWSDFVKDLKNIENSDEYKKAINGETNIDCFNDWIKELKDNHYLHNHTRMWFASIWIFTLKLPWQKGAEFFLRELYDGDAASNTLSWRWVAGIQTKGKNYIAQNWNINKFTDNKYKNLKLNENPQPIIDQREYKILPLKIDDNEKKSDKLVFFENELDFRTFNIDSYKKIYCILLSNEERQIELGDEVLMYKKNLIKNQIQNSDLKIEFIEGNKFIELSSNKKDFDVIYPSVGENMSFLKRIMKKNNLMINYLIRDEDKYCWQFSNKGYFNFKSNIPKILSQFKLN
ncbi:FAD-binding domain-containing protein [Pelagibacteraceae bacterium]|nr:FAD-binding domain-containing protein [Pelagibacteraceae bacterium]